MAYNKAIEAIRASAGVETNAPTQSSSNTSNGTYSQDVEAIRNKAFEAAKASQAQQQTQTQPKTGSASNASVFKPKATSAQAQTASEKANENASQTALNEGKGKTAFGQKVKNFFSGSFLDKNVEDKSNNSWTNAKATFENFDPNKAGTFDTRISNLNNASANLDKQYSNITALQNQIKGMETALNTSYNDDLYSKYVQALNNYNSLVDAYNYSANIHQQNVKLFEPEYTKYNTDVDSFLATPAEGYNETNIDDYKNRIIYLAYKSEWTDAELKEAKQITKVLDAGGLAEGFHGYENYRGNTLAGDEYNTFNSIKNILTSRADKSALSAGVSAGLDVFGVSGFTSAAYNIEHKALERANNPYSDAVAEASDYWNYGTMLRQENMAAHPLATFTGSTVGSMILFSGLSNIGKAVGDSLSALSASRAGKAIQSAVSLGTTMASSTALGMAGYALSGQISAEDYVKSVAESGALGVAGSALTSAASIGLVKAFQGLGIRSNIVSNSALSGLSTLFGFGTANSLKELKDYLSDKENYKFNAVDFATNIAFITAMSVIGNFKKNQEGIRQGSLPQWATVEKADIAPKSVNKYFGDIDPMDANAVKSRFRELTKQFHPDIVGENPDYVEVLEAYDYLSNQNYNKMQIAFAKFVSKWKDYKSGKASATQEEVNKAYEEYQEVANALILYSEDFAKTQEILDAFNVIADITPESLDSSLESVPGFTDVKFEGTEEKPAESKSVSKYGIKEINNADNIEERAENISPARPEQPDAHGVQTTVGDRGTGGSQEERIGVSPQEQSQRITEAFKSAGIDEPTTKKIVSSVSDKLDDDIATLVKAFVTGDDSEQNLADITGTKEQIAIDSIIDSMESGDTADVVSKVVDALGTSKEEATEIVDKVAESIPKVEKPASVETVSVAEKPTQIDTKPEYTEDERSVYFKDIKFEKQPMDTLEISDRSGRKMYQRGYGKTKTYIIVDKKGNVIGQDSDYSKAIRKFNSKDEYWQMPVATLGDTLKMNENTGEYELDLDRVFYDPENMTMMGNSYAAEKIGVKKSTHGFAPVTKDVIQVKLESKSALTNKESKSVMYNQINTLLKGDPNYGTKPGILINGERYVFHGATSSGLKQNKIMFMKESLHKKVIDSFRGNLTEDQLDKLGGMNISKLLTATGSAYTPSNADTGFKCKDVIVMPEIYTTLHDTIRHQVNIKNGELDINKEVENYKKVNKNATTEEIEEYRKSLEANNVVGAINMLFGDVVNDSSDGLAIHYGTGLKKNISFQLRTSGGKGMMLSWEDMPELLESVIPYGTRHVTRNDKGEISGGMQYLDKNKGVEVLDKWGQWRALKDYKAIMFESTLKFSNYYGEGKKGADNFYKLMGNEDIRSIPLESIFGAQEDPGMIKGFKATSLAQQFRNQPAFTEADIEAIADEYTDNIAYKVLSDPEMQAKLFGVNFDSPILPPGSDFKGSLLYLKGEEALTSAQYRKWIKEKLLDIYRKAKGSTLYFENEKLSRQYIAPDIVGLIDALAEIEYQRNEKGRLVEVPASKRKGLNWGEGNKLGKNEVYNANLSEGDVAISRNPAPETGSLQIQQNAKNNLIYNKLINQYGLDKNVTYATVTGAIQNLLDNDFDGDTVLMFEGQIVDALLRARESLGLNNQVFTGFTHGDAPKMSVKEIESYVKTLENSIRAENIGTFDRAIDKLAAFTDKEIEKALKQNDTYKGLSAREFRAIFNMHMNVTYVLSIDATKHGNIAPEFFDLVKEDIRFLDDIAAANGYYINYDMDNKGNIKLDKNGNKKRNYWDGKPYLVPASYEFSRNPDKRAEWERARDFERENGVKVIIRNNKNLAGQLYSNNIITNPRDGKTGGKSGNKAYEMLTKKDEELNPEKGGLDLSDLSYVPRDVYYSTKNENICKEFANAWNEIMVADGGTDNLDESGQTKKHRMMFELQKTLGLTNKQFESLAVVALSLNPDRQNWALLASFDQNEFEPQNEPSTAELLQDAITKKSHQKNILASRELLTEQAKVVDNAIKDMRKDVSYVRSKLAKNFASLDVSAINDADVALYKIEEYISNAIENINNTEYLERLDGLKDYLKDFKQNAAKKASDIDNQTLDYVQTMYDDVSALIDALQSTVDSLVNSREVLKLDQNMIDVEETLFATENIADNTTSGLQDMSEQQAIDAISSFVRTIPKKPQEDVYDVFDLGDNSTPPEAKKPVQSLKSTENEKAESKVVANSQNSTNKTNEIRKSRTVPPKIVGQPQTKSNPVVNAVSQNKKPNKFNKNKTKYEYDWNSLPKEKKLEIAKKALGSIIKQEKKKLNVLPENMRTKVNSWFMSDDGIIEFYEKYRETYKSAFDYYPEQKQQNVSERPEQKDIFGKYVDTIKINFPGEDTKVGIFAAKTKYVLKNFGNEKHMKLAEKYGLLGEYKEAVDKWNELENILYQATSDPTKLKGLRDTLTDIDKNNNFFTAGYYDVVYRVIENAISTYEGIDFTKEVPSSSQFALTQAYLNLSSTFSAMRKSIDKSVELLDDLSKNAESNFANAIKIFSDKDHTVKSIRAKLRFGDYDPFNLLREAGNFDPSNEIVQIADRLEQTFAKKAEEVGKFMQSYDYVTEAKGYNNFSLGKAKISLKDFSNELAESLGVDSIPENIAADIILAAKELETYGAETISIALDGDHGKKAEVNIQELAKYLSANIETDAGKKFLEKALSIKGKIANDDAQTFKKIYGFEPYQSNDPHWSLQREPLLQQDTTKKPVAKNSIIYHYMPGKVGASADADTKLFIFKNAEQRIVESVNNSAKYAALPDLLTVYRLMQNPLPGQKNLKTLYKENMGEIAADVLDKWINDVMAFHSVSDLSDRITNKMMANMSSGYLFLRPGAIMKQVPSLFTSMGEVGVGTALKSGLSLFGWDIMAPDYVRKAAKENPVLRYRSKNKTSMGEANVNFERIVYNKMDLSKINNSLYVVADLFTEHRGAFFQAYDYQRKIYIKAGKWNKDTNRPNNIDGFIKDVNKTFTRLATKYAPYYELAYKTDLQRSNSIFWRTFGMFTTMPSKQWNNEYRAKREYLLAQQAYGKDKSEANKEKSDKAKKSMRNMFAGNLISSVLIGLASNLASLIGNKDKYKDEDGEFDAGKFMYSWAINTATAEAGIYTRLGSGAVAITKTVVGTILNKEFGIDLDTSLYDDAIYSIPFQDIPEGVSKFTNAVANTIKNGTIDLKAYRQGLDPFISLTTGKSTNGAVQIANGIINLIEKTTGKDIPNVRDSLLHYFEPLQTAYRNLDSDNGKFEEAKAKMIEAHNKDGKYNDFQNESWFQTQMMNELRLHYNKFEFGEDEFLSKLKKLGVNEDIAKAFVSESQTYMDSIMNGLYNSKGEPVTYESMKENFVAGFIDRDMAKNNLVLYGNMDAVDAEKKILEWEFLKENPNWATTSAEEWEWHLKNDPEFADPHTAIEMRMKYFPTSEVINPGKANPNVVAEYEADNEENAAEFVAARLYHINEQRNWSNLSKDYYNGDISDSQLKKYLETYKYFDDTAKTNNMAEVYKFNKDIANKLGPAYELPISDNSYTKIENYHNVLSASGLNESSFDYKTYEDTRNTISNFGGDNRAEQVINYLANLHNSGWSQELVIAMFLNDKYTKSEKKNSNYNKLREAIGLEQVITK